MKSLIIRNSRVKALILTIGSLLFVAGGILILAMDRHSQAVEEAASARAKGWLGIVFFGGCALVGTWEIFDSRPRLIIDDQGVYDRTLRCGWIPWSEILGARLMLVAGQPFIGLDLRDMEARIARSTRVQRALTAANQSLGYSAWNLNLSQVDVDAKEVHALILQRMGISGSNASQAI
ncbi:MAG: hypothetical protein JWM59_1838 [Verrucomicrobiales bacterium]|nr:hypothetical protein [Verrucomicrobiales bacterium]